MKIETYRKAIREPDNFETIGTLGLPTGSIVCCDPFFTALAEPYVIHCHPGNYSLRVWRTNAGDQGRRIAFCELLIEASREVCSLEPCVTTTGRTGFVVESGLAAFMDERVAEEFTQFLVDYYKSNNDGNYYDDVLSGSFSSIVDGEYTALSDHVIHEFGRCGSGIAIFKSGSGDGIYSTYVAKSVDGKVLSFIADFGLTDDL